MELSTPSDKIEQPTDLKQKSSKNGRINITNGKGSPLSTIEVRGACKAYGSGKKKIPVLDNLDMTVPQGSIYGLLGPSGCGKTTLLGTIVNTLHLDKGHISICGYPPGTVEAAVPGHRIGFMPQELALYPNFQIAETLYFFGRIHKMSKEKIKERTQFLIQFLDLPEGSRLISQLSGGQQRRVSFAVALLHEPEVLILDEPTVGVDPLLRTSIWEHLVSVSKESNATIIITTHYIEEARQATRVGLMRKGRLLAEASPSNLLDHFANPSLEEVFLHLCLRDGELDSSDGHDNSAYESDFLSLQTTQRTQVAQKLVVKKCSKSEHLMLQEPEEHQHLQSAWSKTSKGETYFSTSRFAALLYKSFLSLARNPPFLLMSFLLPTIQTALFCLAVGGTPSGLKVAVTNLDEGVTFLNKTLMVSDEYLNSLDHKILEQKDYASFDDGYSTVVDGKTWAFLYFDANYSNAILAGNEDLYDPGTGQVKIYLDATNQQILYTILLALYRPVQMFFGGTNSSLGLTSPLLIEDPVYGNFDASFTEFMAPGILLSMTYFMAVGLTAMAFIIEKKEGLYGRSWVAGVANIEIMLSHLITQLSVMMIQIATILIFMFGIFKIPCLGSFFSVILLSLFQGLCGMTLGMVIAVVCDEERTAMMAAMGIFYPMMLVSGIVWPVQGMPVFLRYIAYLMPQTYATDSMRAILYKGWGISHFTVYIGYIMSFVWIIIHSLLSVLTLKLKNM